MPVKRIPLPSLPKSYTRLVEKLADELRRDSDTGSTHAPEIIEKEQRGGHLQVTVIWDAWRELPLEDRGRAIMDAYEKVRPDEILRITVAMGLTHAEAKRLGRTEEYQSFMDGLLGRAER